MSEYRGRLAPSPTGYLHLGHARTFWVAQERARAAGGALILRIDDLDEARCRDGYVRACEEDLTWFGFEWAEGPDVGGAYGPYRQSERAHEYREAFETLRERNAIFPCGCSRRDIVASVAAPHAGEEEALYPGKCRGAKWKEEGGTWGESRTRTNWRFRIPDGEAVTVKDGRSGVRRYVAGRDFGDFVVWRGDGVPSYQLACVVDDARMGMTEVVRGEDLLLSTARQVLLYRALGWDVPGFYHCPLVRDETGERLAKRHEALSLRRLREMGTEPSVLREGWSVGNWEAGAIGEAGRE